MILWLLGVAPLTGTEWRQREERNPFTNIGIVRILEIRGGWVKYHFISSPPEQAHCQPIRGFRENFREL